MEKYVFSKEELIEKCLQKIAGVFNDSQVNNQLLKIHLIEQWIAEIKRIQNRKELEE